MQQGRESMQKDSFAHAYPLPTLPRKRGREQTEFAARVDSISHERALDRGAGTSENLVCPLQRDGGPARGEKRLRRLSPLAMTILLQKDDSRPPR
jgi:hypothetical protein